MYLLFFFIYTQIIKSIYIKIHKLITNISLIYYRFMNFIFIFFYLKKLEALSNLSELSIKEIMIFYILNIIFVY